MARFYGVIGFAVTQESEDPEHPGVFTDTITERNYYGDITKNARRFESGESINDNIVLNNQISILSDEYANENFHLMRYVTYMGSKWKISSVDISYPRLILTTGGLYNEE